MNTLKHLQTADSVVVFLNFCRNWSEDLAPRTTELLTHLDPWRLPARRPWRYQSRVLGKQRWLLVCPTGGPRWCPTCRHEGPPHGPRPVWDRPSVARAGQGNQDKDLSQCVKCSFGQNATLSLNLTTTAYGAWGLPEEMRANWGPGTHLTTTCRPFLQGIGLLGIDSWAWHSDRQFSLPRQWTFSTQNPFFFAMRLSLYVQMKGLDNTPLKSLFLSSQSSQVSDYKDGVMKNSLHFSYLVEGSATLVSHIFLGKKQGRRREAEVVLSDLFVHLLRSLTQTHRPVRSPVLYKPWDILSNALYLSGPHTKVFRHIKSAWWRLK